MSIMPRLRLGERLIDPKSPDRRPRRAAYALPTLFTAGNLYLGFLSILKTYQGVVWAAAGNTGHNIHFELAAILIGVGVFLDGLDGRIARMTNTMSDFGREMDSLADVITFGLAPAVLAYGWGFHFVDSGIQGLTREHILRAGTFAAFVFLLCSASRLARFNIQTNPIPKNPGRPDRKYFVGLPTPAAAAMVASVVYAAESEPLNSWLVAVAWMLLLFLLSFLLVSTWRYRSFKDFNLLSPRSFKSFILTGMLIYLIWNYSQPVLLGMATVYTASGIIVRAGGIVRRRFFKPLPAAPERQAG
jgi:CDP-diacylglycerol--serine O-phosphatidyltransferase